MNYLKYQKLYYLPFFAVLGVLIILISLSNFQESNFWIIWSLIIVLFIYQIILSKIKKKNLNALVNILLQKCDPIEFIKIADDLIKSKYIFRNIKYWLLYYLMIAYRDLNDYDMFFKILQTAGINKLNRYVPMSELNIYTIEMIYSYNINDIENAELLYEKALNASQKYKSKKEKIISSLYIQHLNANKYYLQRQNDKCYEYFFSVFHSKRQSVRNKVLSAYLLGVMNTTENKEEAKCFFEYVIKNGNTMNIVSKAKLELNKL